MTDPPKQTSEEDLKLAIFGWIETRVGLEWTVENIDTANLLVDDLYRLIAAHTPQPQPAEAGELRDGLTEIMYGADWRKDPEIVDAFMPDVEAALKLIATHLRAELQALREKTENYIPFTTASSSVPAIPLAALDEVIERLKGGAV